MLDFYRICNTIKESEEIDCSIKKIENFEQNCWINCTSPTENEIEYLIKQFNIEPDFLKSALDEEESSNVDKGNDSIILIIDTPVVTYDDKSFTYSTIPLSFIFVKNALITISISTNTIIEEFSSGILKNTQSESTTSFMLQVVKRTIIKYLQFLRQIDKLSAQTEKKLRQNMKNQDLMQLLEIEKSLVYLSSSLKAVNITLQKMAHGRFIKLSESDTEVLEDVMVEFRQAIDMSDVYFNITDNTMEAFSSILSNNLNTVMKVLTSITLIISIPTLISGIYGMNCPNIPTMDYWQVPFGLSIVVTLITWWILKRKDMM